MPFNLLKVYNQHLELFGTEAQIKASLKGVFNRDIGTQIARFNNKAVYPTSKENGEIPMETLFTHLTTQIVDKKSRERAFEHQRSKRLHWVKYHLNKRKEANMLLFSVKEPEGIRTYYYDKDESYVIVLEPLRDGVSYYLLTAYYVTGKDAQRNKIERKYKRRMETVL